MTCYAVHRKINTAGRRKGGIADLVIATLPLILYGCPVYKDRGNNEFCSG
jgi:hypothetical protein